MNTVPVVEVCANCGAPLDLDVGGACRWCRALIRMERPAADRVFRSLDEIGLVPEDADDCSMSAPFLSVALRVRAVRHYHQIKLLPEPARDASGYRRYGAAAAVSPIKIRILANAGVPLSQIGELLRADVPAFAEAVQRIDDHLHDEIERLEVSRKQIAQLGAGDSLVLPPEVVSYLDRLREIGVSKRMLEGERDGWILLAARWPDPVSEWMTAKFAELEDPRTVRLYRVLSELFESDAGIDDPRLVDAADIMAAMFGEAYAVAGAYPGDQQDDLPFDLMDSLALESDPRSQRLMELMRERGWNGWIRVERLPEPPG